MTKPGDSQTTKKTIHELAQEFPEKTYTELEKYRDADRQEEAQRIITQQENEELKENQYKEDWKEKLELKIEELQNNLDRLGEENNDLYKKIAKLKEAELAAHSVQKARESGL